MSDLQDGISCVVITASLRDIKKIWVYFVINFDQPSGVVDVLLGGAMMKVRFIHTFLIKF